MELEDLKMRKMEEKLIKEKGLGLITATFFLAGTMAGSGVLALPLAMVGTGPAELGVLLFFALNAAFVGIKLGQCWVILEERYPEYREQVRDPYPTIAEKAGGKIGRALAVGCINVCLYGAGCVFLVLISSFVSSIFREMHVELSLGWWMVIVAGCLIPPCWLGTPNDFWPLAIGALLTTVAACVMVIVKLAIDVPDPNTCFHGVEKLGEHSSPTFAGIAGAFSSTMFAFAGAPNFPTIQSDMKDRRQFTTCVLIAMAVLFCIYSPMAGVGYWLLGDAVSSNVVNDMCDGPVKIAIEVLLLLHLVSAFPIVVNPSNQFFEGLLKIPKEFNIKRVLFRTLVILFLLFIAESLPDFGSILDLVGGATVTPLTFIFPPFFYMRLIDMSTHEKAWTQRKISRLERFYCWFVIIVGLVGGVTSTYNAIVNIVSTNFKYPCYIHECLSH